MMGLGIGFIAIMLFIVVFMIVSMWKIYEKAGQPGWASIVPIYNIIVYIKIIKKPMWWIVMFLIPVVNYVFLIWSVNLLSKRFGWFYYWTFITRFCFLSNISIWRCKV